jgi:hypothetical protein
MAVTASSNHAGAITLNLERVGLMAYPFSSPKTAGLEELEIAFVNSPQEEPA